MVKKFSVFLMASTVLMGSLVGCGGSKQAVSTEGTDKKVATEEETTKKAENTQIVIWHQYEEGVAANIQEAFKVFESKNPNIKVTLVKQNELANKMTLIGQSPKDSPDIVFGPNDWAGRFALMGIIDPIDSYIDMAVLDDHLDTTKQAVTYQDKYYAVPLTYECLTFMYNKKVIQGAPQTTDELLKLMKEQTSGDKWGFISAIGDAYHVMPWIYGNGGYAINNEAVPGLDQPGTIDALKFVQEMKAYMPKNVDYATMDGLFKEGKVASVINGSWAIKEYQASDKIDLGVDLIPTISKTGKRGQPFLGVQAAFATVKDNDKEAVGKVLDFLAGEEVGKAFADTGYLVSNKNIDLGNNEIFKKLQEQAALATPMPATPEMSQVWEPLAKALNKVITEDNVDVAVVLDEAQKLAVEQIEAIK